MLTEKEFTRKVTNLPKTIAGKRGDAFYTDFKLQGITLYFKRVNTGKGLGT
jgi:hypothetical protein